jgi:hypothetical protein
MSDREAAQAALAAAEEALAAERRRHESARSELAQCQGALDATDPDDRKALDKAIASHGAVLARVAALAARESKAAAVAGRAREAVAAVERAETEALEDARRTEIEQLKAGVLAKLNEARESCNAAFARLAELGEPDEAMPAGADIRWTEDEAGREVVTLRVKRATPARPAPEPVSAIDGYDAVRAAVRAASAPQAEDVARERTVAVAQEVRRYEIEAERLSR